jgi:hypothetical protein
VIIKEESEEKLGAIVNPITIPKIPVPKNIIIRTFSRRGLMYFIYKFFNILQYYKLTVRPKWNFLEREIQYHQEIGLLVTF